MEVRKFSVLKLRARVNEGNFLAIIVNREIFTFDESKFFILFFYFTFIYSKFTFNHAYYRERASQQVPLLLTLAIASLSQIPRATQSNSSLKVHSPLATMKKGSAKSTLSNLSASDTAYAPTTAMPSPPAGPSHIRGVDSMQSVIDDLAQLAETISQDRAIHIYSKDMLLNAHVVGDGFIDKSNASDEEDMNKEGYMKVEPALFIGNNNSGDVIMNCNSEYIDDDVGEEEDPASDDAEETDCGEALQWLNNLGDHIVSYFSKDAVYSFPTSLLT